MLMVEDTRLHSTSASSSGDDDEAEEEESEVEALAQVDPGENVRKAGSDAKQGDLVLDRGTVVHAHGGEIGTLAFVGRTKVLVYKKPVVAVLSTGNELLDLHAPQKIDADGWGGIWDTNRPSLQGALEGMGYQVVDLGIVGDDLDSHVKALKRGLDAADLILTTGGTSMGASDLLKPVIERHLNGTIHFGRVKMKPGKPTTFATVPTPDAEVPVFALPGNPASALVTFHVFVVPALRKLGGWSAGRCQLPRVRVKVRLHRTDDEAGGLMQAAVTDPAPYDTGPTGRVPPSDDQSGGGWPESVQHWRSTLESRGESRWRERLGGVACVDRGRPKSTGRGRVRRSHRNRGAARQILNDMLKRGRNAMYDIRLKGIYFLDIASNCCKIS